MKLNIAPGTLIVADIDGTVSNFVDIPSEAVIVPKLLQAAARYNAMYPDHFVFVTGRDMHDAEIMVHPENSNTRFPYLSNHGAIYVNTAGEVQNLSYSEAEQAFIKHMTEETVRYFTSEFPDTVFDIKEDAALGLVDLSKLKRLEHPVSGPLVEFKQDGVIVYLKFMESETDRLEAVGKIKDFLEGVCSKDLNPVLREEMAHIQDDSGQSGSFALKQETADQMEIRGPFSKGATLFAHNIFSMNADKDTACFVDTLGPSGTDRTMAKAVRQLGGEVVLVLNDRTQNHPQPNDSVYPDLSVGTPDDLAEIFDQWVSTLEKNRGLSVQSGNGQFKPASFDNI